MAFLKNVFDFDVYFLCNLDDLFEFIDLLAIMVVLYLKLSLVNPLNLLT